MTIDFVVGVFVVRDSKVLLIFHKKLQKWLPLGGHIDEGENPEEAAHREVMEESGLEVELIGTRPDINAKGVKPLIAPMFMDIHEITPDHKHIGLMYVGTIKSGEVKLNVDEHEAIQWFTLEEIERHDMPASTKFYSKVALETVGKNG